MTATPELSQRLIRKGALTSETYEIFRLWDEAASANTNLAAISQRLFKTLGWAREVQATLRRRFRDIHAAAPLILLAKQGLPFEEWRSCLLLWVGVRERFFQEFVVGWLYPRFEEGVLRVRVDDARPFVTRLWREMHGHARRQSEYGEVRTTRDVLRMARDFGILSGDGPAKTFASFHLSDRCFLFWAHAIAEQQAGTARIPASPLWRLALMRSSDVERELLRLHQFRRLEYHVAGSLVQLELPCRSASEYAERMVA
jgi:hypothetical protein